MYRTAFLGVGPRARGCAEAYEKVDNASIVAACNRSGGDALDSFCKDFGVASGYTNAAEMLDRERPDLVHIVTGPKIRPDLMRLVSDHGVPVSIVEKPIAVQAEDWRDLVELSESTSTRFVVNTQLHFHPANLMLKEDVAAGRIGEIRYVDASARSTVLNQGVHILELMHSYTGWAKPLSVYAQSSGTKALDGEEPSPDTVEAAITFDGGIRGAFVTGSYAPRSNPSESIYHHKRISAYGTKGFVHWTMVGWERYTPESGYERGEHLYRDEDLLGQAGLTSAALELIEHPEREHPTRLERSLLQFNIILGVYMSTIDRRPVDLPCDPPDGLIRTLGHVLGGTPSE